ncbi:MAG: hypothetical protein H7844_08170 [Nitrospirae bacterium YQR-1]
MDISLYNISSFKNTVSVLGGGKREQGGQNATSSLPTGQAIASAINENISPASIYTPPKLNLLDQLSKSMLQAQQEQQEDKKNEKDNSGGSVKEDEENPLKQSVSSLKTLFSGTQSAETMPPSSNLLFTTEHKKALNSYQSASMDFTNTTKKGALVNFSV